MSHNTQLRNDALAAYLALLPSGATLILYNGTPPASGDAALSGNQAVATHTMAGWGLPLNGVASASAIANATIANAGPPTFGRITQGARTLQLSAGASGSGANIIYGAGSWVVGGTSQISSITVTWPAPVTA
jgi:hypothetical protein